RRAEEQRQSAEAAQRREQERADAERAAKQEAQRLSANLALAQGQSLSEQGDRGQGLLWLARGLEMTAGATDLLARVFRSSWAHWRSQVVLKQCLDHDTPVAAVAMSPDGKT